VAGLILSIDTGDSKILWGTRLAAITTSCPSELPGTKAILTTSEELFTVSS
jgi:hypothetical protein